MAVTIEKIMDLPSMRGARVLAGARNLDRAISSVSVLEYADTTPTQQELFDSSEFFGGELVITSFANVAGDVAAQMQNVRMLASVGEAGIVLYYVGILMPRVDEKLVQLCEDLGFVLICMPENDHSLRYSDAICEVMELVTRDRIETPNFALDLLEQMSRLPSHQRTMDTTLKLVSDRLRATVVLTDSRLEVLNACGWPRGKSDRWKSWMDTLSRDAAPGDPDGMRELDGLRVYRRRLHTDANDAMALLVFCEDAGIEDALWEQAAEAVRLAANLWGRGHDRIGLGELVKSIVQDEPIKMRRLASIYGIDVASLSDVWILRNNGDMKLEPWTEAVHDLSERFARVTLCECYENDILIFPVGTRPLSETDTWTNALVKFCESNQLPVTLTRCIGLATTADAKDAYLSNHAYVDDAAIVFPEKTWFTLQDIRFVRECRRIASYGEAGLGQALTPLAAVTSENDRTETLDTLASYLLDNDGSVTGTSKALFVHKNTVKYRLQRASERIGFRIGSMPASFELLQALALRRLTS